MPNRSIEFIYTYLIVTLITLHNASISPLLAAESWQAITNSGPEIRCSDPFSCAKASFLNLHGQPNGWKGCYITEENDAICEGYMTDCQCWTGRGIAVLNCTNQEYKFGYRCTKTDRDPTCESNVDNPVDAKLGTKYEIAQDYLSYNGLFKLERYYYSTLGYAGARSVAGSKFGEAWRSNFDVTLSLYIFGTTTAYVVMPNGKEIRFNQNEDNGPFYPVEPNYERREYQYSLQRKERLIKNGNLYELITGDDTRFSFNADGNLAKITQRDGYFQDLMWSSGKNSSISDSFGQTMSFTYGSNGLVSEAIMTDGSRIRYQYKDTFPSPDPNMPIWHSAYALTKVVYPDGTPGSDADNPILQYFYENTDFPLALTGKTDERGVRVRTWSYNADGRVSQITLPNNPDKYTFSYDLPNRSTTVTNPAGKQTIYRYTLNVPGSSRLTAIEGVPSANCVGANTSFAYDGNGFLASRTDGEGRKTTYVRDQQGNPTSITRGAP